jgi:hypothetical protein
MTAPSVEYGVLFPVLIVFGIAVAGVLVEAFLSRRSRYPVQVTLSLAGLLQLEGGLALAWPQLLRRSLRVMAAALPMALVLFLLVPRVGPFGPGLGTPGARASTGLSDDLDPGSIATLVDNASPAARVAFSDDNPPPPGARYWRVLVHPRFDGRRWQEGRLLSRGDIKRGKRVKGPALLEDPTSTLLVPEGWTASRDENDNTILKRKG